MQTYNNDAILVFDRLASADGFISLILVSHSPRLVLAKHTPLRLHESHNHRADKSPFQHPLQLVCGLGEVGKSVATLELAVLDDAWGVELSATHNECR